MLELTLVGPWEKVYRLVGFQGEEGLSRPFSYRLQLERREAAAEPVPLGKPVAFEFRHAPWQGSGDAPWQGTGERGATVRRFGGLAWGWREGLLPRAGTYELEVVPRLMRLSHSATSRVFAGKPVLEIIAGVLKDHDVPFEQGGLEARPPRELCVQYRETAFNFVSRLLEEEGIAYYFRHDPALGDVLHLAEKGYKPCEGLTELGLGKASKGAVAGMAHSWGLSSAAAPAKCVVNSHHFPTPRADLVGRAGDGPGPEMYDHGGFHTQPDQAGKYARVWLEEMGAQSKGVMGTSDVVALVSGHTFTASAGRYLLTSVRHHAGRGRDGQALAYGNTFEAVPSDRPWRPTRHTAKPSVPGYELAWVVDAQGKPEGPAPAFDGFGRVRVRFWWERGEAGDCWARVVQPLAGQGFGAVMLPRPGQMVAVQFLGGDPDCPLVIGAVYNQPAELPFAPPERPWRMGLRTRSGPEGGQATCNEVALEDTAGRERIYVKAQRDFDTVVTKDTHTSVGGEQHLVVARARHEKVGADQTLEVGGARTEVTGGPFTLDVGGGLVIKSGGSLVLKAESVSLVVGGNFITLGPSGVVINGATVGINPPGASAPQVADAAKPPAPTQPPPLDGA